MPKAVGSEALVGQKTSGNRNRLEEEVLNNVETDAEGIVEPRRIVGAFMTEVKNRLDTSGLSRDEPERILEEEDEIEPVPTAAMVGKKTNIIRGLGRRKGSKNKATARRLLFSQGLTEAEDMMELVDGPVMTMGLWRTGECRN